MKNFLKKIFKGNTLYYPGCSTKFAAKHIEAKYKELLNQLGIDYITLADFEKCCGSPILNAGYKDIFLTLAKDNLKIFKERGVDRIITNCPGCYLHFKKVYPEYLGKEWDIEVEFFLNVLWEKVQNGEAKLKKKQGIITYHDPCHLGRAMNEYDIPRLILEHCGYTLREMSLNKEYSLCCGAGGTVNINSTNLSNKMGKERLEMAEETEADVLTTPCVLCNYQFLQQKDKHKIKIKEFSELIDLE